MALKFRRGTTAQQSGSLAFGEPYVNTTLGTLLVGGPNGDIVLSSTGTGSTGVFGAISGSGLDITGNANIAGNLTLGGNITIGDATTDTVVINADLSSSIIPDITNVFDVGSPTKLYKNVYANNISASSVEIMSGSNPELRLLNKTTGIAYHIQNGDAGNFTIHNSNTNRIALMVASSSVTPNVLVYANLIVSQSVTATQYMGAEVTASLSGSVAGIGNVTTYSASVVSRLNQLSTYTGSNDTTNTTQNTRLTALEASASTDASKFTTLASVTSSYDGRFTTLATTTGSLQTSVTNLNTFSASALTRLSTLEVETANLESTTASLNTSVSNLNTFSASENSKAATLANYTGSVETRLTQIGVVSGSLILSASADAVSISNLNTFSASENSKAATLATYTASVDGRFTTIASVTASYDGRFTSLATVTGSLISSASNANGRLNAIEAVSGTFARTNSANVFSGNQTITGSLFVSQDLIVAGSSSIQNVSSSTLNIGTNLITVAVNQPSVRFGGIAVIDSGSSGGSGSFLYDSVHDEFIFVHRGNGTNVTSSHFVLGPETYDNLGNETYLTNNRVPKGSGKEHLNDSQISDDGTTVTIPGALTVTGNITGPIRATNGVVSGSSQITYASISSIPAGIVSGAAQLTSILPSGVVSGSSQIVGSSITTNTVTIGSTSIALGGTATTIAGLTSVSSTGFTGALTGNASTATTLQTARTINGTSFNGSADITIPNLVSGSSQVIGILSSLNSYTASNDTTNTTQNTRLTALEASASTALSTNNTQATSISNLNSTTASLLIETANLETFSASALTRLSALEVETANLETFSASALTRLANLEGTDITISLTGDVTGTGTITNLGNVSFATTVAANSVALGTDTTGDYVASLVAGTGVTLSNNSGEGATPTIAIGQAVATTSSPTFAGLTINGAITATGDITAFFTSDKRHKNNIQIIPNALDKVRKLNGVTWEWNDDVNEVTKQSPKTGLIAQEVLEVLPEVVKQKEDGFLGLDYSKMVGLLVEAIKEQQLQIERLRIDLDNCRNKGL